MTKVSSNQTSGNSGGQTLERTLLEYLKPKPEDRFSKLEAYCDLLSRASSCAFVATAGDRKEELVPGQFVASISELSRKWKWQRATTRQFIDGLVALGQISYTPFVKNFIFTVNLQQRLSVSVKSSDDVLDFCCMQFGRFIQGRTTLNEVADSYDRYYGMKMEVARELGEGGAPVRRVLNHQAYMFNELASSIFLFLKREDSVPEQLSDSVTLLFGRDQLWNWHKVIASLGILTIALRDNTKPSYMAEVEKQYTKAEINLLDCIFEHYAANDGSTYYTNPPRPSEKGQESANSGNTTEDTSSSAEGEDEPVKDAYALAEGETLRQDSAEGNE